jgi:hypothetical protein
MNGHQGQSPFLAQKCSGDRSPLPSLAANFLAARPVDLGRCGIPAIPFIPLFTNQRAIPAIP